MQPPRALQGVMQDQEGVKVALMKYHQHQHLFHHNYLICCVRESAVIFFCSGIYDFGILTSLLMVINMLISVYVLLLFIFTCDIPTIPVSYDFCNEITVRLNITYRYSAYEFVQNESPADAWNCCFVSVNGHSFYLNINKLQINFKTQIMEH